MLNRIKCLTYDLSCNLISIQHSLKATFRITLHGVITESLRVWDCRHPPVILDCRRTQVKQISGMRSSGSVTSQSETGHFAIEHTLLSEQCTCMWYIVYHFMHDHCFLPFMQIAGIDDVQERSNSGSLLTYRANKFWRTMIYIYI